VKTSLRWRHTTFYGDLPVHYVAAGGLLSYGIPQVDPYLRAASYVDRILRGANPAELPVEAADKLELMINLKTAKALGLPFHPRSFPSQRGDRMRRREFIGLFGGDPYRSNGGSGDRVGSVMSRHPRRHARGVKTVLL
jgi:hypothetical protein